MRVEFLVGGLAVGAALAWRYRHKSKSEEIIPLPVQNEVAEDWSMAERIALGAAGGGLLIYGMRSKSKLGRVASLAGAGMLARSVRNEAVHELSDVVNPRALLLA